MRRATLAMMLTAAVVCACGTTPSSTDPVYNPRVEPTERPIPLATPTVYVGSTPDPDPTVARRATLYRTEITRFGLPFGLDALQALGWYLVDVAGGSAKYYQARHGREDVNWKVPPTTIAAGGSGVWINGEVTSIDGSSLNLQPAIYTYGFDARDVSGVTTHVIGTQGVSQNGNPTSAPEVRLVLYVPYQALVGEEARIEYTLGWQAEGVAITYRYRFER